MTRRKAWRDFRRGLVTVLKELLFFGAMTTVFYLIVWGLSKI